MITGHFALWGLALARGRNCDFFVLPPNHDPHFGNHGCRMGVIAMAWGTAIPVTIEDDTRSVELPATLSESDNDDSALAYVRRPRDGGDGDGGELQVGEHLPKRNTAGVG